MKTILKTNLVIYSLLLAIGIQVQDKPLTFGVKADVNLSNMNGRRTCNICILLDIYMVFFYIL